MLKVSIGCGINYDGSTKAEKRERKYLEFEGNFIDGWIGIDKGEYGQHYNRDLRRGLPFSDNTVDQIFADNILEHIPVNEHFGEDDFIFIMNECLRVLKPKGRMIIIVPYAGTKSCYKDPTHYRFFNEITFRYLQKGDNIWDYGFVKNWNILRNERPKDRNEILIVEMEKIDE